jgi:hypothetical protein
MESPVKGEIFIEKPPKIPQAPLGAAYSVNGARTSASTHGVALAVSQANKSMAAKQLAQKIGKMGRQNLGTAKHVA